MRSFCMKSIHTRSLILQLTLTLTHTPVSLLLFTLPPLCIDSSSPLPHPLLPPPSIHYLLSSPLPHTSLLPPRLAPFIPLLTHTLPTHMSRRLHRHIIHTELKPYGLVSRPQHGSQIQELVHSLVVLSQP